MSNGCFDLFVTAGFDTLLSVSAHLMNACSSAIADIACQISSTRNRPGGVIHSVVGYQQQNTGSSHCVDGNSD